MINELMLLSSQNAIWLPVGLFVATLIAEDLATMAAGVLAAQCRVDPVSALGAVILGTATGDLALYAVGRWGAETKWGRRLRRRADVKRAEQWLAGRLPWLTVAARFVPGLRLPVYTASGLGRAPLLPFVAIIALSTPVWTGLLFNAARLIGEKGARHFLDLALGFGILVLLLTLLPRPVRQRLQTVSAKAQGPADNG